MALAEEARSNANLDATLVCSFGTYAALYFCVAGRNPTYKLVENNNESSHGATGAAT